MNGLIQTLWFMMIAGAVISISSEWLVQYSHSLKTGRCRSSQCVCVCVWLF